MKKKKGLSERFILDDPAGIEIEEPTNEEITEEEKELDDSIIRASMQRKKEREEKKLGLKE